MATGDDVYVDGHDLASMSRGGNLLERMGYDPDEVRMNPGMRQEVMTKVAGPYSPLMAQNDAPPNPNNRSQNGNDISAAPGAPRLYNRQQPSMPAPAPAPAAPAAPLPATLPSSVSPSGNTVDVANARQATANLLAPEPAVPDTSKEDATIASHSVPLNPREPIYKEGRLGRIGRGFEAAAVGFGKRGVPGAIEGAADPASVGSTPYGAPNSGYAIDEATRQAQLKQAQDKKADIKAKFQQLVDLRKDQDAASDKAGTIANTTADLPNKAATANADMTRANNESKPKTLDETILAYRTETDPVKKEQLRLAVDDMYNDQMKLKPPRQPGDHPSAELEMFQDWKAAFTRDNKRPPTGQEIEDYHERQSGQIHNQDAQSIVAQATQDKQKFADGAEKLPNGSYVVGSKVMTPKEFQSALDKYRTDANVKLSKLGYEVDEQGNMQQIRPTSPSAATPPAPAATPKLLSDGSFEGMAPIKKGEIAVIAPDGTPGYIPGSKLKAALAKNYKRAKK